IPLSFVQAMGYAAGPGWSWSDLTKWWTEASTLPLSTLKVPAVPYAVYGYVHDVTIPLVEPDNLPFPMRLGGAIRILGVAAARRFVQSRKDSGQGSARGRARCPSEQLVPATPRPIAEPRRCRRGTRDERPKEHVVPASISAERHAHADRAVGADPDRGVSAR